MSHQSYSKQLITGKIESFLNNKFSSTAEHVDEAAKLFEDIIISSAHLSLRRKKPRGYKKSTRKKKWFDEELYVKRRTLTYAAQNWFNQPFNKIICNTFIFNTKTLYLYFPIRHCP